MAAAVTVLATLTASQGGGGGAGATISVDLRNATAISDNLYGIFSEDINHAADGGLYAELVQNRSFEFNKLRRPHLPRAHRLAGERRRGERRGRRQPPSEQPPLPDRHRRHHDREHRLQQRHGVRRWRHVRLQRLGGRPFDLKYVGLGNKESNPQFYQNHPYFHEAVRQAYPDIRIVSNSGFASEGPIFDRSWEYAREMGADLVDEHYYKAPQWFFSNNDRYDDHDRAGPHVDLASYAPLLSTSATSTGRRT